MLADDKGGLMWDGRPVQMCSESERWRAQTAMQLTIAALTGSKAVVLDRGDILDNKQRGALYVALKHVAAKTNIAIVLCATTAQPGVTQGIPTVRIIEGRTELAVMKTCNPSAARVSRWMRFISTRKTAMAICRAAKMCKRAYAASERENATGRIENLQ